MTKFGLAVVFLLIGVGASWLTPWSRPRAAITVTGEAKQSLGNQLARLSVTVTETNKNKDTAVEAVNRAMESIVAGVKDFGIEAQDLTTQNFSVYEVSQPEIMIYPPRPGSGEKQWQASNSLVIILRDVAKASALADLLQGFPQAQLSGPSFSLDNIQTNEQDLLVAAMADARAKAEKLAAAGNRKLGRVLTVDEGFSSQPYPVMSRGEMAADKALIAAPVEPGSTQISKTLTVVFELK